MTESSRQRRAFRRKGVRRKLSRQAQHVQDWFQRIGSSATGPNRFGGTKAKVRQRGRGAWAAAGEAGQT